MGIAVRHTGRGRIPAAGRHYLPDLVYGANDGIITTFAVVRGGGREPVPVKASF